MKHLCTIAFLMLLCKGVFAQAPFFPEQWPLQIDSLAYQPLVGEWVDVHRYEAGNSSHIVYTFNQDDFGFYLKHGKHSEYLMATVHYLNQDTLVMASNLPGSAPPKLAPSRLEVYTFSFEPKGQLLLTMLAWDEWAKIFHKTEFRLRRFNPDRP